MFKCHGFTQFPIGFTWFSQSCHLPIGFISFRFSVSPQWEGLQIHVTMSPSSNGLWDAKVSRVGFGRGFHLRLAEGSAFNGELFTTSEKSPANLGGLIYNLYDISEKCCFSQVLWLVIKLLNLSEESALPLLFPLMLAFAHTWFCFGERCQFYHEPLS